jgi:hypothetical protein
VKQRKVRICTYKGDDTDIPSRLLTLVLQRFQHSICSTPYDIMGLVTKDLMHRRQYKLTDLPTLRSLWSLSENLDVLGRLDYPKPVVTVFCFYDCLSKVSWRSVAFSSFLRLLEPHAGPENPSRQGRCDQQGT